MTYIETNRLKIRPLRLEDAQSLYSYASDPEVAKYVSWSPHQSIEDSKAFIHEGIKQQTITPLDPLAIAFKDAPDILIGAVGMRPTLSHPYEGLLSYVLGRQYWQQGLMFEACSALIDKAFKEYGYKRIYAFCLKENIASKSLMKKLGMTFEGCLRSRFFRKDKFWDVDYFAILEDEWRFQRSFSSFQQQNNFPITYEPKPSSEDVAVLDQGIEDNARLKKGMDPIEPFAFFVKDQKGQVLAGCRGDIIHGCVYTGSLWVSEPLRGKGIGTRLLQAAEQLAREKGCAMATINTMDWEALELYQSLGYKVDLARKGYKNNSTFYFLKKELM
ncbi:MAG: N-acetyltransferase [Alphaproteobacteria bacterium]|jgi:RimJ/RimL family protein N-acetyltransferase|nr:N-acetyltransferase [Alphaproteobacteria bacterium]MBP7729444.1 N-acetyltransferase [Alphaproteobacteria bacterium]